jgi:hypothetical protein
MGHGEPVKVVEHGRSNPLVQIIGHVSFVDGGPIYQRLGTTEGPQSCVCGDPRRSWLPSAITLGGDPEAQGPVPEWVGRLGLPFITARTWSTPAREVDQLAGRAGEWVERMPACPSSATCSIWRPGLQRGAQRSFVDVMMRSRSRK